MVRVVIVLELLAVLVAGAYLIYQRAGSPASAVADAPSQPQPAETAQGRQLPVIAAAPADADVPIPPAAEKKTAVEIEPSVPVSSASPSAAPAVSPAAKPVAVANSPLGRLQRPRVVIRKSAGLLTVYDAGREVKSYPVAVGGGRGDKRREGDRCTPEGRFVICLKNPHSKYVLSLGLNYPNREDAERGLREGLIDRSQYRRIVEAVSAGRQPPWDTPLGGEIMIHGRRDGRESTLGCVAMDNPAIRELYAALPVGVEVIIQP